MQEKSAAYMTARTAYHQMANITIGLKRATRPKLPAAIGHEGDDEYMQQIDLWDEWIRWEKEDPVVLKEEDLALYHKRILYTYKQALMALQFWPEMWYSAAEFCFTNALESEGISFLDQGIEANPEAPLLAFLKADRLEVTTQNDESADPGAKDRMKKVREPLDKCLEALYALVKTVAQREKEDTAEVENAIDSANGDAEGDDDINAANIITKKAVEDAQIDIVKKKAADESNDLRKTISSLWITVLRAARRIQGKGTGGEKGGGFRAVFNEARKRGTISSHFYVEAARTEWQCYRDPAGSKILERGIKLFPEDGYLPLQYIKHLFELNDVTNARGVFETTVTRFLAHKDASYTAKTKPLFIFMHDYESRFGELAQIQKLEQRMRELFPEDPQLTLFSERYTADQFSPTRAFPIISRQQLKPKTVGPQPVNDMNFAANSPIQRAIDAIATNSPKRSLPDDFDDDSQARKVARVDSPLKGAAGRKMNQQRLSNGQPIAAPPFALPPPLPPQLHYLLTILPKASTYVDARFDAAKMVELIRDVHLPPPGTIPPQHQPQPPHQGPPAWQQQQQPQPQPSPYQHQPPPALPGVSYMPPGPPQGQYGAGEFTMTQLPS